MDTHVQLSSDSANARYDGTHPHGRPCESGVGGANLGGVPVNVAAVLVLNPAGQILSGFNNKRHVWDLPQGVVEPGENARIAAVRELFEETAIVAHPDSLRKIGEFNHQTTEFIYNFTNHLFILQGCESDVRHAFNKEPDKCLGLKWFAPCQLPYPRGLSLRLALVLLGKTE